MPQNMCKLLFLSVLFIVPFSGCVSEQLPSDGWQPIETTIRVTTTNGETTYINTLSLHQPETIRGPDGALRPAYRVDHETDLVGGATADETYWLDGAFRLIRLDTCVEQNGECRYRSASWPKNGILPYGILWPMSVAADGLYNVMGREPEPVKMGREGAHDAYSTTGATFYYEGVEPVPDRLVFDDAEWEGAVTVVDRGDSLPEIPTWPAASVPEENAREAPLFPGAGQPTLDLPYPVSRFYDELLRQETEAAEAMSNGGCVKEVLPSTGAKASGPLTPLQATTWDVRFHVYDSQGRGGKWTVTLARSDTTARSSEDWTVEPGGPAEAGVSCDRLREAAWPQISIQDAIRLAPRFAVDLNETPIDYWYWTILEPREHQGARDMYLVLMRPADAPDEQSVAYLPIQMEVDPLTGWARAIMVPPDQWDSFDGQT